MNCRTCKQEKNIEDFYKDPTYKSGYKSDCKTCKNNYRKWWNKHNPEKRKAYRVWWRKNNRDKVNRYNRKARKRKKAQLSKTSK